MNKTEDQNLDTTPALVPLEASLPTETPTSMDVGQKPQSNPDPNDQEPSLDPEHEKEDESKPFQFRFRSCRNRNLIMNFGFNRN